MLTEKGAVINKPLGQKQNRRSSTNNKIYLADDLIGPILYTMCFIKSQCYNIDGNIMPKVIYATLSGWSRIGGRQVKSNQSTCVSFFASDVINKKLVDVTHFKREDVDWHPYQVPAREDLQGDAKPSHGHVGRLRGLL